MRAVIAACLAAVLTLPAQAQQVAPAGLCASHAKVVAKLQTEYGETLVWRGLAKNGGLLEILAGPIPSYSVIMTMPNMPTCLIGAGDAWEALTAVPGRDL